MCVCVFFFFVRGLLKADGKHVFFVVFFFSGLLKIFCTRSSRRNLPKPDNSARPRGGSADVASGPHALVKRRSSCTHTSSMGKGGGANPQQRYKRKAVKEKLCSGRCPPLTPASDGPSGPRPQDALSGDARAAAAQLGGPRGAVAAAFPDGRSAQPGHGRVAHAADACGFGFPARRRPLEAPAA